MVQHAPALALSPDGRTAAVGLERGIQLVDVQTGDVRRATGGSSWEPELGPVQPGRRNCRLDEPRRDRDALGRRDGGTPRDVARPLELRPATRLRPGRKDAVHGKPRRDRNRLGHDGQSAGSGGCSAFTHDRTISAEGVDGHPGGVQPRRPPDRRRPQEAGDRALGRARAQTARCAPAGEGRRGQGTRLLTGRAKLARRHSAASSLSGMFESRSKAGRRSGAAQPVPWSLDSARTARRSPRRAMPA